MEEWIKYGLAVLILILGYFLGGFLRKLTMDEQKDGRKYFIAIIVISIAGMFAGLFLSKDWVIFTSAFFTIVTSRNLK